MAEAIATLSLLANIVELVNFSAVLVERIDDFATSTRDVPDAFRNISMQLPLASAALQRLSSRIGGNELTHQEEKALQALVDRCKELIQEIDGILSKTVPSKSSSSLEKRLLAIKSLRHDKRIQSVTTQLLQNVSLLTFFQTTQKQESATNLIQKLSTATLSNVPPETNFQQGLNLGGAPHLADGYFVGREVELDKLSDMLQPESQRQSVVAVTAMGGMGKTQLCIEYAVTYQSRYSSIFWLNAQDEPSLRADLLNVAEIILPDQTTMMTARTDEEAIIQKLRRWFSHPDNRSWLLIFDNLDNPKVPGDNDPSSVDVRQYFPFRSQGSILITTRSRKISFAKQLLLGKLETPEQEVKVLSARSGRTLTADNAALKLVKRLDGLPLALASAASFLERTSLTVQEYLDEYEKNWVENDADNLFEYGDRTLFTTWNMSFEKLRSQDAHAAELLRILAYFGNENIYYDLLSAHGADLWPGLGGILRTKATFERSMARLRDYSLIETSRRCYRLHPCVHDWTLSSLNQHVEESEVWCAISCVVVAGNAAYNIWERDDGDPQFRLASHAMRLMHPGLHGILENSELDEHRCNLLSGLGGVLAFAGMAREAAPLLKRALNWSQKHLGEDHQIFLNTSNVLGLAQQDLENFSLAESLMKQAIDGCVRTLGKYARATLDPVHNLALFYTKLKRFEEAEEMYLWSLRGCEESYGPLDVNTFWAMSALAEFYRAKEEPDEVERYLQLVLKGLEAAADSDHYMSRFAAARLGAIYEQKGDYDSAVAMFQRVYDSCCRVHGPDHWSTLEAQNDLARLEAKSPWETRSGSPSTLVAAAPGGTDVEQPKPSDEAVNTENSSQGTEAGKPSST